MPYREKRIYSGKNLEVEIYPISLEEKKKSRKTKMKESSLKQKNLNDKNAVKHLIRLLNNNFTDRDLAGHYTYDDKHLPSTPEEAKKDIVNYLRRVKRYMKKHDLGELKYIAVIEFKEQGVNGKGTRLHHHIIISGGIDRDTLESLWGKGRVNIDRLQADENGYEALGRYVSKDPKGCKRWIQSRNLKQPVIKINDNKFNSKKKLLEIANNPGDKEQFEKLYKGYFLNDCNVTYNEENGHWYLYIKMRKLMPYKNKGLIKKKDKNLS